MRDIDEIKRALVERYPGLKVTQLEVPHRVGDDDGLWFFSHPSCPHEVQLEASTGNCPFLLESDEDDQRLVVATIDQAIHDVAARLGL